LPFAIIVRGRRVQAPWLAALVALLLLASSAFVPRSVEWVTLFAARPPLPLVSQSIDLLVLPPPPPPPPAEPPPQIAKLPVARDSSPDIPRAAGKPPPAEKPVRVSDGLKEPRKVKNVAPVYPALAQAAGIEGVVILELTIGAEGKVIKAQVLKSQPLLDQAAIDAVMQWEYAPTVVDGRAVPVILAVTVPFRKRAQRPIRTLTEAFPSHDPTMFESRGLCRIDPGASAHAASPSSSPSSPSRLRVDGPECAVRRQNQERSAVGKAPFSITMVIFTRWPSRIRG
jgi:TonB family protein